MAAVEMCEWRGGGGGFEEGMCHYHYYLLTLT